MSIDGSLQHRTVYPTAEVKALRSVSEVVVSQISNLGFGLKLNEKGEWYVAPKHVHENWTLVLRQDRWFLCIENLSQIAFHTGEMLAFLQRRNHTLGRNK